MISQFFTLVPYNNKKYPDRFVVFTLVMDAGAGEDLLVDFCEYKKENDEFVKYHESVIITKDTLGDWDYGKHGAS